MKHKKAKSLRTKNTVASQSQYSALVYSAICIGIYLRGKGNINPPIMYFLFNHF